MGQEYPFQSARVRDENPNVEVCIHFAIMSVIVSLVCLFGTWIMVRTGQDHQISTSTSMSIANLDLSLNNSNGSSLLQSLNITFKVDMELQDIGVTGGMKYENSTIFLRYRGMDMDMDMVPISSARVAHGRSRNVSLSLTFDSRRLLEVNSSYLVSSDGLSKLQTYVRFSGKGRCLIFMIYPVFETIHDLFIDPASRIFTYRECQKQINWRDSSECQKPLCQA